VAFCSHTILQDENFIAPDARADSRFANNPLVVGGPHFVASRISSASPGRPKSSPRKRPIRLMPYWLLFNGGRDA
jgi:hypothetical protein